MNYDNTIQGALFEEVCQKAVVAQFDQPDSSSDGGAILLKAIDNNLNLTQRLANCLTDKRDQSQVKHTYQEQLRQRVFGLAFGYEDCNDVARVADDPMVKLAIFDNDFIDHSLASQPTLSRFENGINARSLLRMAYELADIVINRHRERLADDCRVITIDMDPTDDRVYGVQQLSFFNGHYDNHCYLPMACFLNFDNESDHYLFAYLLRPGNVGATFGAIGLLKRAIPRIRQAFPGVRIRVRLDGGFSCPDMYEFLEDSGVEYVIAIASNATLQDYAEPLMQQARAISKHTGKTEHVYGECDYGAQSWDTFRRVIIKAEVVRQDGREPRDNPRFVVTNLKVTPKTLYEKVYCARGDVENRIKELLYGLSIDRTSCHRFFANTFRGLLTAAAYILFQEIRLQAQETSLKNAQVTTLRERLLKIAVWLQCSTRRIVLHLPRSAPWKQDWLVIAKNLGAVPL